MQYRRWIDDTYPCTKHIGTVDLTSDLMVSYSPFL